VTIEGVPLPPGWRVIVNTLPLKRGATPTSNYRPVEVDSKGDFVIENLVPDTYEVEVLVVDQQGMKRSAKQTVTTSVGAPGYVSLSLDIRVKGSDQ
jgi:hypothetical protein